MNKEQLLSFAQSHLNGAQATIDKLSANLKVDPVHALSWCGDAFGAAGDLTAWRFILNLIEGDTPLENIVETLESYVVQGAARPPHTSSPHSNLVELQTTRAYAEAYRELKRRLGHMQMKKSADDRAQASAT